MKKILFAIFGAALLLCSCHKEVEPPVEPQLPVTFTNTAGEWRLVEWRGQTDVPTAYIRLKDKEFVLWQTAGSMYPTKVTGSYNLVEEEGVGMIIRGMYDFTYEYWEHMYLITSLTASKMEWTSMDDPTDISVYERTPDFPE
ncbi:MAG: hypothetical protein MJZ09_04950 [Bacteroidales bacterium]|nr:hypothetical protein [Bacteroidales bacterium]